MPSRKILRGAVRGAPWGIALVFVACGGSESAAPEGPTGPSEPGFSLTVPAGTFGVQRGGSSEVRVSVTRQGGFIGPVVLAVTGAPEELSAAGDTVPARAGAAFVTVSALVRSRARTTTLTVEGSAPGLPVASVPLPVKVQAPAIPFDGTIFIHPDIITPDDPTTLGSVSYTGIGARRVYDRRVSGWITMDAHLFDVQYSDGLRSEAQVNPEFDLQSATSTVAWYAEIVGRLPRALRRDVDAFWIHRGIQPFGGGNRSLLIHTGQGDLYDAAGILEETLVHEAAHTSLDASIAASPGWLSAQLDDGTFISTYARDNPGREDVAETFVPYLAVRYRADRIPEGMGQVIGRTIPFRIQFLDSLGLDLDLLRR